MAAHKVLATVVPVLLSVSLVAAADLRTPDAAVSPPPVPTAAELGDEDAEERRAAPQPPGPEAVPVVAAAQAAEPQVQSLAVTDLAALGTGRDGVPDRVRAAYQAAAAQLRRCGVSWQLLAAIGRVESDHGRYGGAAVLMSGRVEPKIIGPRLDGTGPFAVIRDTDGGAYDGDVEFDRAVGPMQFIPSTWARWASDGDGDGTTDPHDVDDVALAAGRYLCASGSLTRPATRVAAVYSYNRSYDYVRAVLIVAAGYLGTDPAAYGVGLLPAPAPTPSPSASPTPSAPVEPVPGGPPPQSAAAEPAPAPAEEPAGTAAPTAEPAPEPTPEPTAEPTGEPAEQPAEPPVVPEVLPDP